MRARTTIAARVAALLLLSGAVAPLARADNIADAEVLFRRAKALMAKKAYAEACPLFESSYEADPAMGTLLNLAICHERVGRTASAWGEFRAVEQKARAAGRADRARIAHKHAEKLEPKLSRLELVVPESARADGLTITIDGEEKAPGLWAGMPVDPGSRKIEVSAPGKLARSLEVTIEPDGARRVVEIAPLEDVPAPPPKAKPRADLAEVDAYAEARARRTTGFVVGGIGVAALAIGGGFGVAAILGAGDGAEACPSPCYAGSEQAVASDQATDRALTFANIANVVIPVGVIGAAVGTWLVLTAGPTKKVAVTPYGSAHAAGLDVRATW